MSANVKSTDVTNCFGNSNGSITISDAAGGSGKFEYSIGNGEVWKNANVFSGLASGSYNVQIRDAVQPACTLTLNNNLILRQPDKITTNIDYTDAEGCAGNSNGSITFSASAGGSGGYEYSIDNGNHWSSSRVIKNLAPGNYPGLIRDVQNPTCQVTLGNIVISNNNPKMAPVITSQPAPQGPICEGSGKAVFSVTASGSDLKYQWRENGVNVMEDTVVSNGNAPQMFIVNPGSGMNGKAYDVVVEGSCGTVISQIALLTVINKSGGGTLSGGRNICYGDTAPVVQLKGQYGNIIRWEEQPGSSGNWRILPSVNSNTYFPGIVTESISYRVVVKNGNCKEAYSTIASQMVNLPASKANAGTDQSLCGLETMMAAETPEVGSGSWHIASGQGGWIADTLSSTAMLYGIGKQTYEAVWTVRSGACAPNSDTVKIILHTPVKAVISEDKRINAGEAVMLEAGGGSKYTWEPDPTLSDTSVSNPVATTTKSKSYTVKVYNEENCMDTATVRVKVRGVIIPQVFTPNDDNNHDTWNILNIENYPDAEVEIFNRWGQMVTFLKGAEVIRNWNGEYKGSDLPVGTYYYVLKLAPQEIINGSVSIMK